MERPQSGQSKMLPPRVQNAISRVMAACADGLSHPVRRAMSDLRDEMPLMIGNPAAASREIIVFSHCKSLSLRGGDVLPALLECIEHELANIRQQESGPRQVDLWSSSDNWTLADGGDDRAQPQADGIGQVTNQCKLPLYLLGQRFGVLAGAPAFDADRIPVGPRGLLRAIDAASRRVFGDDFPHALLTEVLSKALFHDYPALLTRINRELEDACILPGLTFIPSLKRAASPVRRPVQDPSAPENPGIAPVARDTTATHPPQVGWFEQPVHALPAGERFVNALSAPGFAHARALLAKAKGRAAPGTVPARMLPQHLVSGLVDQLSTQDAGGRRLDIRHLHDQLRARAKALSGGNAELSPQQNDSIELLGMLYDTVSRDMHARSGAAQLLRRLQIPLLRMALAGDQFFEQPAHPGRRIMSRVAESGAVVSDEADVDPQFDAALAHAVDRVENEYRGEEAVLERIHQELDEAHQAHARRSEAVERHQIEASRGLERIAIARDAARALIDEKLEGAALRPQVELLIRTAWQDALTFIRVRHDDHSALWQRHERLTTRMVDVVSATGAIEDVDLRESVHEILKRTGYHSEEAGEVAATLSRSASLTRTGARMSMTELVTMIRTRPRFGETSTGSQEAAALAVPRTAKEEECYRHACTLPFGCWLDFTINQQGDVRRRRLSWYSRITGNVLLVNRRGARVADMQLDQLARLMAADQVRLVRKQEMSLLDRAWASTLGTLESLGKLFTRPLAAAS